MQYLQTELKALFSSYFKKNFYCKSRENYTYWSLNVDGRTYKETLVHTCRCSRTCTHHKLPHTYTDRQTYVHKHTHIYHQYVLTHISHKTAQAHIYTHS